MVEKATELQAYEKPAIVDHGDLRGLTEGGFKAEHLDGTYSTPRSRSTTFIFSG